eukprot:2624182-Rhodomonas_salina.2
MIVSVCAQYGTAFLPVPVRVASGTLKHTYYRYQSRFTQEELQESGLITCDHVTHLNYPGNTNTNKSTYPVTRGKLQSFPTSSAARRPRLVAVDRSSCRAVRSRLFSMMRFTATSRSSYR